MAPDDATLEMRMWELISLCWTLIGVVAVFKGPKIEALTCFVLSYCAQIIDRLDRRKEVPR